LETYNNGDGVVKIIVGNKSDKHGREVARIEGEALAQKVSHREILKSRWGLCLLKLQQKQLLESRRGFKRL
jgi:hypothetical protein